MNGTTRRLMAIGGGLLVGLGLIQVSESEGFHLVSGLGLGLLFASLVRE